MKNKLLHVVLLGIGFGFLFNGREAGINVQIFQIAALGALFINKTDRTLTRTQQMMIISTLMLIFFSFAHHSSWAIFWSWISLGTTAVVLQTSTVRQISLATLSLLLNVFQSPFLFIREVVKRLTREKEIRFNGLLYVFPPLGVMVFGLLYAQANPDVDRAYRLITGHVFDSLELFFENLFSPFFIVCVLGTLLATALLYGKFNKHLEKANEEHLEDLNRTRNPYPGSIRMLKTYYKAALITVISLCATLVLFLFFEIRDVWIDFHWNGGELKYFVHQGTYVLIFSILVSAAVVLFFFNDRLNFYPNSRLRNWSYIWLALNAVLAVSVVIRTLHYIDNFALAYLRIGVLFFIAACLLGLYSVYYKIKHRKGFLFLLRYNSIAALAIILAISSVNWDVVITKYNFNHRKTAFVHLKYLSEMSDKTLPLLLRNSDELAEIKTTQKELSKLDTRGDYYISEEEYSQRIQNRISSFKSNWESKSIWEWNLPEYRAYRYLSNL